MIYFCIMNKSFKQQKRKIKDGCYMIVDIIIQKITFFNDIWIMCLLSSLIYILRETHKIIIMIIKLICSVFPQTYFLSNRIPLL